MSVTYNIFLVAAGVRTSDLANIMHCPCDIQSDDVKSISGLIIYVIS